MRDAVASAGSDAPPADGLDELFAEAADRAGGVSERFYFIAGRTVLVRYAGTSMLAQLGRSLAHLETSGTPLAALTINVWDARSAGGVAPPLPHPRAATRRGAMYYLEDAGIQVAYQPGMGTLSVLDGMRRHGVYWAESAEELAYWDCAGPMRQLLHWWFVRIGVWQLHAGAVGTPIGGILIVGPGGSGKSTSTLSTLGSQLRYAGDDYVALDVNGTPWVHSLYNSGKLERDHIKRLPQLEPLVANVDVAEKAVVYVHEHFPHATIAGFPLRAVIVPRLTNRATPRLVPATPMTALAALAPSTLLQLHPPARGALAAMRSLLGTIPCQTLELGSDIAAIPDALIEAVRQAA
jgi:hypothetical protein